jgi:hypothetical protein
MRWTRIASIASAVAIGLTALLATPSGAVADADPVVANARQDEAVPMSVQQSNCSPGQGSWQTRFAQCQTWNYNWTSAHSAHAGVKVSIFADVDSRERAWNIHYTAVFYGFTPDRVDEVTATVLAECEGGCSAPAQPVVVDEPVSNESALQGNIPIASNIGNVSTSSQIVRVIMKSGERSSAPDSSGVLGPVRYDSGPSAGQRLGRVRPGCVFPEFVPTLKLNESSPPAPLHARFVADAQAKLGGLGHPSSGRPLHRQAGKEVKDDNRTVACKDFVPNTPPGTPRESADSCDEYPYAGTRESAPGVSQVEHIPNGDNANAGSQYSKFIRAVRLRDGDAFYVDPNV